jgi:1-acyl-sn-glycerol-3-phosphate acyltransferase
MTLLYRALREVLRTAVELFYTDIQSTGRHNVPGQGPVIFAANHPNSIMDTVILGSQTERQISYMARSGLFKNPLVALVFNQCGVIPVYKNPGATGGNNDASFRRAFEVLGEGGAIGIFPEGQNSLEREVLDIKTGTARIALGAEKETGYALGVKVVPVGLNFENRDAFLSRVLVRFAEPIEVSDYAELHQMDERAAVRALTDEIQDRIRGAATHIQGFKILDLVNDIEDIYGKRLLDTLAAEREAERRSLVATFEDLRGEDFDDDAIVEQLTAGKSRSLRSWLLDEVRSTRKPEENLDERFWVKTRIAEALRYFEQTDPEMVNEMKVRVWRYKDHLRQVRLRHEFLERPPETLSFRLEALRLTSYAVVFFLPAAWGFLHNALPYLLTKVVAMQAPDEAMRAIRGLLVGMVVFGLVYAAILAGVFFGGGSVLGTAVYGVSLPVSGFFFMRYRSRLSRYRSRVLTRTLFRTERHLLEQLRRDRERLIAEFSALRVKFLEAEEAMRHDREAAGVRDV